MNNEEKILKIQYLIQREITREGKEQWVNSSIPSSPRRGVIHARARRLRTDLNQPDTKIRVVKVMVYHDQDF